MLNNPANAISLKQQTAKLLATDVDSGLPRKPFHWPLAFPEVFGSDNGGFDAIVGNVPFLGGQRLTGTMGASFRNYLVAYLANGRRGSADLAAYFFLKIYQLLGSNGIFGLLATNTIAEGDTRQIGLETMLDEGQAIIIAAYPSETWPGKAAVVTSRVHVKKGEWFGKIRLNGRKVARVSAFLTDREDWSLEPLKENTNQAFQGSILLGLGFTVDPESMRTMIAIDPRNEDALFPYIGGRDLNSHPEQKPSRWVINFFDWPEERAKKYKEPYAHVLKNVKPERDLVKRKERRENWWHFAEKAPALYHLIGRGDSFENHPKGWSPEENSHKYVLISTRVTKHLVFSFVPNIMVYDVGVNVFTLPQYSDFATLQSSIHAAFVWKHASRLKNDLRYTPSDVYLPFPKPKIDSPKVLEELGEAYHQLRSEIMLETQIGLTKLYNRFHDHEDTEEPIVEMRDLHKQIDEAVASAYGWDDLDLEHDFHEVDYLPKNDRVRFTISEKARNEVLDRLTLLNKERFAQEQKGVLKTATSKGRKYANKPGTDFELDKVAEPKPQMDIFGNEE